MNMNFFLADVIIGWLGIGIVVRNFEGYLTVSQLFDKDGKYILSLLQQKY